MDMVHLLNVKSRVEMIRELESITDPDEAGSRSASERPLVKSHLVEVLSGSHRVGEPSLVQIFQRQGIALRQIDDDLFLVLKGGTFLGFLERFGPRFAAIYSTLKVQEFVPPVRKAIRRSSELDHAWISGVAFDVLWRRIVSRFEDHRFSRLVFEHESIFDVEGPQAADSILDSRRSRRNFGPFEERRLATFRLVERIAEIRDKLPEFQKTYAPLYAIGQIRFPSSATRGGHDLYADGRITNRSDSFRDHRSHVRYIIGIYAHLLDSTEHRAWPMTERRQGAGDGSIMGEPVIIQFSRPLRSDVFERWVSFLFSGRRNRFRLWGNPIRLGPQKVHVAAVDRHLWQPVHLELTSRRVLALLPYGSCGNIVHRLLTNIQKFLDPGAAAFVGESNYRSLVELAIEEVDRDDDD